MNYEELRSVALRVKNAYDKLNIKKGEKKWGYLEYTQGLVGDIGELIKMLMAKSNFREYDGDLNHDIKHELADCLWAVIVISEDLGIDLADAFKSQMTALAEKVEGKLE